MKPDQDQEIAAKYIDNHSLIIAGAGTGKTTTLLYKIEYLIKQGIKENEILVISFTNETVNNFINKCKYKVNVYTFHKLANIIINSNKDIVGQEILEDCIRTYFKNIPKKLKQKLCHSFCYSLFTEKYYLKRVDVYDDMSLSTYFYQIIKQVKANNISINDLNINQFTKIEQITIYCIKNIIEYYNQTLSVNNFIDFDELIIEATKYINDGLYTSNYKYILVDEYQDISIVRLDFLKSLIKNNNAILTAVGDDFQSIYGFNGSNINLFYNFQKHFKNSKVFYIKTTYRCPKKIIKKAGEFIMKNPYQIKKEIISKSKIKGKIIKIRSTSYKRDLIRLIKKYRKTNFSVLILSRNGFDINFYKKKKNNIENSYIVYKNETIKNIRFLTIHKSKGLEADIVIVLNMAGGYNGFPGKTNTKLINKILSYKEEYKDAEERRLFYVALTRAKIKIYLIIDKKGPSDFISEI